MRTQIFLATAALAAAVPAQTWNQVTLLTSPSQRRSGAAAFEGAPNNRLIFLGGVSPTPSVILPETWRYTGSWLQLTATTTARWGHRLVRNTATNRLIAFGGRSPTISGFANDTVQWDGTQWSVVPAPTSPSTRYLYGMVYDQRRSVVVLFGGRSPTQTLGDTWEFDGVTWTQRTLNTNPGAREEMAMVYDAGLGETVLFGGYNRDTNIVLGDTWHYDGSDWSLRAPNAATTPSARYRAAADFDSTRQRMVLFGGFDGTTILNTTYEYTGEQWQPITTTTPAVPPAPTETLHAYDPVRKKFVVFGGFGGAFSNQTWEYTVTAAQTTGTFSRFGTACATQVGEANITSSTPRINQTWTLTVDNMPTDAEAVAVVIGFSKESWNGLPLPFDLGLVGLPGCNLLVSADTINLAPAIAGTGSFGVPIPNNATFVGFVLYAQGLVLDLDVPTFFTGTTKGGRAVIGS